MKNKLIVFCLGVVAASLIVAGLVETGKAVTVNPASAVTADSANTALTIPYRDASGNFAAGTITANVTSVDGGLTVPTYSSTSLRLITPTYIAEDFWIITASGKLGGRCVSTGTALGQVAISSTVFGANTPTMCGF